jgi:hypothetical protein
MTTPEHPITPPPELVQQWRRTAPHPSNEREHYHFIATCAAQWGADQTTGGTTVTQALTPAAQAIWDAYQTR